MRSRTRLTSTINPSDKTGGTRPGAVGAGAHSSIPGGTARPARETKQTANPKPGTCTISNRDLRGAEPLRIGVAAITKVAFSREDRVQDVIRNFNADGFRCT
jgi:hypothetical protein